MRRELLVLVLVVVIAILAGVGTAPFNTEQEAGGNNAQAAVQVPFTEITEGFQSSISERVNYLIKSEEELEELWTLIEAQGEPPAVDFASERVIAVFAGERPTGGYRMSVSKIEDSAQHRVVTISLMQPALECATTQAITAPYEILKVPATALPFTHQDTVQMINCSL